MPVKGERLAGGGGLPLIEMVEKEAKALNEGDGYHIERFYTENLDNQPFDGDQN